MACGRERATLPREDAGDRVGRLVPRKGDLAALDLMRLAEIEERREQVSRCDDRWFGELRDRKEGAPGTARARVDGRDGAVGGAEIDGDQKRGIGE
jgi:hypothetical protein